MASIPPYLHDDDDDDKEVVVETRAVSPSHLLFKIESFSLLSKNAIDMFETSDFIAGDYKWKLIIYPDGRDKGNKEEYVSVYLAIADTTSLPATWEVNAVFSIFLHNQKLDNYTLTRGRTRRFHALNPEWGYSRFISKKGLIDPSNGYLVNDNCTFGAEVFVIKSQLGAVGSLSLLKLEVPYKHTINISNFSQLQDVWDSENFIVGNQTWQIKVYPSGNGDAKGKSVSIFLYLVDSKSPSYDHKLKVEFSIAIKNRVLSDSLWFIPIKNWGWHSFIPIEEMDDPSKGFVVKDCCTIEVEILVKAIARNTLSVGQEIGCVGFMKLKKILKRREKNFTHGGCDR